MQTIQQARSLFARTVWLAALTVLCHGFISAWGPQLASADILTTLCSASGPQQILLNLDNGQPEPDGHPHSAHCPLCLAGAHFASGTFFALSTFAYPQFGHRAPHTSFSAPKPRNPWRTQSARAPPLVLIV